MNREIRSIRLVAHLAVWTAVAAAISGVETMIPFPLPWIRLGLANIVTLIVLVLYGAPSAISVQVLRSFVVASILGTIATPAFLLSILAGIGSVGVMSFLYAIGRKKFGLAGLSVAGAWTHMAVQFLIVALVIVRDPLLFIISGPSLLVAILTGFLTAAVAGWLLTVLRKSRSFPVIH